MELLLIRHGESTSDVEGRYGGSYDDDLSDRGRAQVARLASELERVEALFSSPYKRAIQTAEAIANQQGLKIAVLDTLRERDGYGILTGMKKDEARGTHPELVALLERNEELPGAETRAEQRARILAALETIRKAGHEKAAAIAHGGVIREFYRSLGKEAPEPQDCMVVRLSWNDGWHLKP